MEGITEQRVSMLGMQYYLPNNLRSIIKSQVQIFIFVESKKEERSVTPHTGFH